MIDAKIIKQKPIISYWKSGDPTQKINLWVNKLTHVNIIRTKQLTDEFNSVCIQHKNKIFLHVVITGMGKTVFEPNISTVKTVFSQLKKLIDLGFPQKQILVIVDPILPNENGLKALQLLLKLFTEFKPLRLRYIRFNTLSYRSYTDKKTNKNVWVISNNNIGKRQSSKQYARYLLSVQSFFKSYQQLLMRYQSIITIDKGEETLIGVRELLPFGLKNEWFDVDGKRTKLIFYDKNNRFKPIVNLISPKRAIRCNNRCLLCPFIG